MTHPIAAMKARAQASPKRIALPESCEPRMHQACAKLQAEGLAAVVFVGDPDAVKKSAQAEKLDLSGVEIINPATHDTRQAAVDYYVERRGSKGLTREQAEKALADPLFYGAWLLHSGQVDGMVAGAVNTTGNVVKAGLHLVGTAPGIGTISSCFMMILPDKSFGVDGVLFYGDCGVVPNPNPDQLADIAIATAGSAKALGGFEPVTALLSFSTKGSAQHADVDKVTKALEIIKAKRPDLVIDGELQADAALIPSIGQRKAPGSGVAGKANTLIFPDLDAGNIAYKLTERLAKAEAYGPLLQGFAKPMSDLSRGCSAQDIVNIAVITALK